jgi:beta-N-acetylhexosaminidase
MRPERSAAPGWRPGLLGCALLLSVSLEAAERQAIRRSAWVEESLAALSLEGKVAQMVMVRAAALPRHPDSAERGELLDLVRKTGVGGVVLFRSELDTIPELLNELQAAAKIPLLVGADVERSLGMRVPSGPVSLPDAMAIGAIPGAAGIAAARFAGELTARESRAAGIHWIFAPVADVNVNPANPIINLRSFGEDPARVAALVAAFVEGARGGGVLTTAKHFPGHGDTAVDSHLELPIVHRDRAGLEATELAPFRAAIAAGVDSIMVGHLALPALDATLAPATLSPAITSGLLRDQLGFTGLVVTDAMDMSGVGGVWMGEAAVRSVMAGADVVLLPPDPRVAIQSIVRAVGEGRIAPQRIDASVRRILAAKERLGLASLRSVDRARLRRDVGRPEDAQRADEIARQAMTLVRNDGGIVPLHLEEPLRVLHLVSSSDWINSNVGAGGGIVGSELEARGISAVTRRVGPDLSPASAEAIAEESHSFTHVLVSAFVRVTSSKGEAEMDTSHAALLERLAAGGAKVVVVSFGSPYLLAQFSGVPAFVAAFSPEEASQRAAVAALVGEQAIGGKLPVTLPGLAVRGEGLELPRRSLELAPATPAAAGFRPEGLAEVDRIVERFVASKAFPGAVLAIGRQGKLAHLKAYGHLSYAEGAATTTPDTIYDVASLTKVVVTTTLAMAMVDEGRLDLDAPVQGFLPEFQGAGKEKVTVRHLLTHSSGIDWWAPLFEEGGTKQEILLSVCRLPLVSEPGVQEKYSDLGILLLGEILERVSGTRLATLARQRIFEPLALRRTDFNPSPDLLANLAPTEVDPGSGQPLLGVVHDENARALGGVAPHAGLFSTAPDLAKFAQMLLFKGVYAHRRIVSRAAVESFTRRQGLPEDSFRGLGWDTRSEEGSSSGVLFSPGSFGHTGFTGTSIWIDPARELFVVLLTNRVHPTRENRQILAARPAIHDAVVRALADPPPVVRVGLDRIADGDVAALAAVAGKRLGLISHAASVTLDGRTALEVLRDRGVRVVRLFSPEHGLAGQGAAGEAIPDTVDAASGLPVVSLYGARRKPLPEDLAGLDALVFDLQDAGVRFYTYASSLLLCLEAAAEAGIELVVLDRPNPLGGVRIAGPERAAAAAVPSSLLSMAPGPLVHGLTLGEMARWANARRAQPARLTVVEMAGWRRTMTWRDTGRRFLPPSPNLRSAAAALAYPGVALLEATNVSEGRGTDSPFLLFGAPWLDPARVRVDVPGFRLRPTRFTPQSSPAAPDPKYRGLECRGFRVEVTDAAVADPWRLGVELLAALAQQTDFTWLRDGQALTALLGTPALVDGQLRSEVVAPSAGEAWLESRRPALLYD